MQSVNAQNRIGWLFVTWIFVLFAFLLAPLIFVVAVSFSAEDVPSFPPNGWSVRWYVHAANLSIFRNGMWTSLWLAAAATTIAAPIGVLAALGISSRDLPGRAFIQNMLLSPLIVPAITIGIAILMATSLVGIRDSAIRLIVGHVVLVLPYSIRTVIASLVKSESGLEEAARTLGANELKVFFLITVPRIKDGIIAGCIMGFIVSIDDVAISIFLSDSKNTPLPVAILSYLEYNFDPSIAAISSILIVLTVIAALTIEKIFGVRRALGV